MALAGAAAGAILVVFSSILGVEACNGHASFCMLPFNQFTFPGTHNSGSFSLNIPEIIEDNIPLVDVNAILSCYYDCHHMIVIHLQAPMRKVWPGTTNLRTACRS